MEEAHKSHAGLVIVAKQVAFSKYGALKHRVHRRRFETGLEAGLRGFGINESVDAAVMEQFAHTVCWLFSLW